MMPRYANQTSTTLIPKTDRLNCFDQSLLPNSIFWCQYFLGGTYCAYQFLHMRCNRARMWLAVGWSARPYWDMYLGQVSLASIVYKFMAAHSPSSPPKKWSTACSNPSKKSTQHWICPVYRPSQQSTNISLVLEVYVRKVLHQKLPCCCLDNANEVDSMLP